MVFYLTNVAYRFRSTRFIYKTQQNFDVQLATCLCDRYLRAESKNSTSAFYRND